MEERGLHIPSQTEKLLSDLMVPLISPDLLYLHLEAITFFLRLKVTNYTLQSNFPRGIGQVGQGLEQSGIVKMPLPMQGGGMG